MVIPLFALSVVSNLAYLFVSKPALLVVAEQGQLSYVPLRGRELRSSTDLRFDEPIYEVFYWFIHVNAFD